MKVLPIIIMFCCFGACKKDKPFIDSENYYGVWVNQANNMDTLFWEVQNIFRTDETTLERTHHYAYALFDDSVRLAYEGQDYIYVLPKTFKITLSNALLTIDEFGDYYPNGEGDVFRKIANE